MNNTVVVLINGEVLAYGQSSSISEQHENAMKLAEGLLPLFASDNRVVVLHGNKPQVGFVLFRSELASHVLHSVPLDVCGADTQGATGYLLSQAFSNVLRHSKVSRRVICLMTQTLVEPESGKTPKLKSIGPWFDREKAEQHRQARGWTMVEEPGRGYRRAVPSLPAKEILEFETIKQLVKSGAVVITAGGGGVPVIETNTGDYEGIEAVLETEQVAVLLALGLKASSMLCVIENDEKFALSGLTTEGGNQITLPELDEILNRGSFHSSTVEKQLRSASEFLHAGGGQVVISTLRQLPDALLNEKGLRIESLD